MDFGECVSYAGNICGASELMSQQEFQNFFCVPEDLTSKLSEIYENALDCAGFIDDEASCISQSVTPLSYEILVELKYPVTEQKNTQSLFL